jgi:tetratricopeptide (TPR) repeat protein
MLTFRRRRRIAAERLREFAETGRRLTAERASAAATVDPLLRNTPRADWPALSELPELQTCGALERLGNLFAEQLTKDSAHAKAIAELAVSVAEAMPYDTYPPPVVDQLRAHAWKDLGKALRFLGRNQEAIEVFATAEEHLHGGYGTLVHDVAIVRFNLAMSLQEVERYDESRALLAESKEIFKGHGDTKNAHLCGFSEGVLLQRLRRFREAREIYLLLLAATPDLDAESRAAAHHAIGFCSVDLGEFEAADTSLRQAVALYRELNQPIHALKAEIGQGRRLVRMGQLTPAVDDLNRIRRQFLKHSLHEEAGICALEIVEAYLMLGYASQAENLAKTIISEFTLAGLNTRAITAVGYLTEAIEMKKAIPPLAGDS